MIHNFITLSTAHITKESMNWLLLESSEAGKSVLPVYKKRDYGVFIYVDKATDLADVPLDVYALIQYALKHNAAMLVLDSDGDIMPDLPVLWEDETPCENTTVIAADGRMITIDINSTQSLAMAMQFKAANIKAKAEPELFEHVAAKLQQLARYEKGCTACQNQ